MLKKADSNIYTYIYKRTIYLSWILSAIIRIFSIFGSRGNNQNHLRFLIFDICVVAKVTGVMVWLFDSYGMAVRQLT